jgi:Zn-dependent protease with chaperone function
MVPLNLLFLGLAYLAWVGAYGLVHLLWHDSQRAEYLADYLASNVSGTDAMLALLEKLHFERSFTYTVQKVALNPGIENLFDELRQRIGAMPEHELERIRRIEELKGPRLDATHPPTVFRIELLKAHPVPGRKVMLSPFDSDGLEQELSSFQKRIQSDLVDKYIASLH